MRNRKQYSSFTIIAMGLTFLFIIGSLLCKISSVTSPEEGGFWVIMSIMTPLFIAADSILLLIWLIRRHYTTSIIIAITIAINLPFAFSVLQLRPHVQKSTSSDFKIATLNTFGFRKFPSTQYTVESIANAMEAHKTDIVCLQEYVDNKECPTDQIIKIFSKTLPYHAIEGSQAIFSKYPIQNYRYKLFEGGNNDYMIANLLIQGKAVKIISVHLQSTGISFIQGHANGMSKEMKFNQMISSLEVSGKYRAIQVQEIRRIADSTSSPTIIAGDFNDLPSSYTYHHLKGKMKDGFKVAGHGFESTFSPMHDVMRIDYIFFDKGLKCIDYSNLPETLSDHKAVIANVKLVE